MPEPGVGRKSDKISSAAPVKKTAAKAAPVKSSPPATDNDFLSGIKKLGSTIAAVPGGIARDVSMGVSAGLFSNRDKQRDNLKATGKYTDAQINDYFARTDATKARMDAEAAARGDRDDRRSETGAPVIDSPPEERIRLPVYRPPVGTTIGRPGPEITPQMRAAALQMFESQRGAGQIPYQMLPYQQGIGSMRPGVSPAFQYAAQNYQRLGGSQRLMDRPMEMMSAAERQRINEMSRAMAERQEYDMGRRMMGKGGGAVEPRRPLPRGFGDDVAPGMAGRSFGIASLRGLPSYLVR